ncbi:hypothetical protein CC85DRAFT_131021 [Cutaneotrichosporon oleaginosum]|uniref:Uncharacterized protein n=1 Tax=Cutaneotrichosporon oleaginosum TaxID=879819 RepID=A0A0J0XIQ6_9TREE|nr:uncharacterized protein CC85DRAFT_131021 [Cutaneotrichosporon oleaginosum]KLT40970.1 hypothetical protein CC85DRAFT_131021 [Cutaneotrichosporon oleaginosum]
MTVTITYGRIQNITLPASGSPPYSHTFKLEQPTGLEFAVVLSDATGWGAGGVSDIQRVQISQDTSCLSTLALADFYFWTEPVDLPRQCSSMRVAWNTENITYPLGLHGFVPGGSTWDIAVPQNPNQVSTNWTVNIDSGTRFILLMTDAGRYGTGGSSPPITVQFSGNDTCMGPDSPRSTINPSPTASSSPSSSPSQSGAGSGGGGGTNVGAIAGGVVGGIVALAIIAAAIWLFCRRRKRSRSDNGAMVSSSRRRSEETRNRLLGRLTQQRTSGHERSGRRPHSGFEIDVFEGRHPDEARSEVDHGENDPHMTPYTYDTPPTRDSMLSTESGGSRPAPPLGPGTAAGRPGQFGEKEMLALSRAGSTAPGSTTMSETSRGGRRFEDLQTVSELAIDSANSGRPVDREALLAFLDPPPTYNQFDLHASNPDEPGDRTSRASGSTDPRPLSTIEPGPSRPRRSEEPERPIRPSGQ